MGYSCVYPLEYLRKESDTMCRPTTCRTCKKTTWAGCGQHVQSVKASVPAGEWCNGTHSAAQLAAAKSAKPSFFARLFGR